MLGRRFSLLPSNTQENIAQQNVDLISSQFLTTLPDNTGFIPNDAFFEIFAQYLGLHSPCCTPFVGQWIGSEGQQRRVNEHGNVVSAHNAVPSAGHTIAHNQ
eukprot:9092025-Ditylum_brightwellii.AAC.1